MNVEELTDLMIRKPYILKKVGAATIAEKYHASLDTIEIARLRARQYLNSVAGEDEEKSISLFETENPNAPIASHKPGFPKILIFDTETAPMRAFVWKRWKENIALDQTISEWFMLCWSAKWLYSGEIMSDRLTGEEAKNEDDSRIMCSLWDLINEADIVIAHNALKADLPWINSRFIVNGLQPPKPYQVIDTLQVVKKKFGFSSNKLDALAGYFGFDHKLGTDFDLWKKCCDGDEEALEYMAEYNKKDTAILELVYLKLRPWISAHPNLGNYIETLEPVCSACGSDDLEEIPGQYYYTTVSKYKLYRCKDCGTVVRGRTNLNVQETTRKSIPIVSPGR